MGARFLHAQPDHVFAILLQFGNERRKVAVARDDDKGVDVLLRVAEVQGVDAEPDVCRVLAADRTLRDLDQLDRRLVEEPLVFGKIGPIRIGLLHDDLSFFDQPLQDLSNLEPLVLLAPESQGEVLKIDKDCQRPFPFSHPSVLSL